MCLSFHKTECYYCLDAYHGANMEPEMKAALDPHWQQFKPQVSIVASAKTSQHIAPQKNY